MVFLISLLTIITGNLFALRQNIKRFLAFSSIAQVGFILIGISGQSCGRYIRYLFCAHLYFLQPRCVWCCEFSKRLNRERKH